MLIKHSAYKKSLDNLTAVIIAFENFERAIYDEVFVYSEENYSQDKLSMHQESILKMNPHELVNSDLTVDDLESQRTKLSSSNDFHGGHKKSLSQGFVNGHPNQ